MKILFKGGRVVSPQDNINEIKDIALVDKKIVLNPSNIKYDRTIDCKGCVITCGLIDVHVHFRDPGFEYKEDIYSVAEAAARGGITTIVGMPNVKPAVDNKTVVRYILDKGKETAVNVLTSGSATKGNGGETLAEIGEMMLEGICAVSDDGFPIQDASLMRRVLEYTKNFNLPFMAHSEDKSLTKDAQMNEGYNATLLGLRPWPRQAEELMIARNIMLASLTGCHVHFQHVTTKMGVDLIKLGKKYGIPITAETCPQYFTLTDDACLDYNTNAKCCPPLRTKDDIRAIIKGLKNGIIDIIATDHAPHALEEKELEFQGASFGMVGLETALGLCLEQVYKNKFSLEDIVEKFIVNPAKLIGSKQGAFSTQELGDLIVFDPKVEWTVDVNKFASKSKNSPFDGMTLHGKLKLTVVKGEICFEDA
ncbi:MAG: dihydroorotase [Abditibacteriota bacterium]|nr:dihydroorotase [Abditibacteriota bacterium]